VSSLRIRYKIMITVGLAVTIGLVMIGVFYTDRQEQAVLAQNERTMRKLTESVIQGLQSVMLAGSADIAQSYADRLKKVTEVEDFRILRITGEEAFRDNKTILEVNRRRGEEAFAPRDKEDRFQVLPADNAYLERILAEKEPVAVYDTDDDGFPALTFYAPILNAEPCFKCHGRANPVRGVIKLQTSLAPVERDILKVRQQSIVVIGVALMLIMLSTGYMMGRTVVLPIEQVTHAMTRVSSGDLNHTVPARSDDELGRMAHSFNRMTSELKTTYEGLRKEQDKLTTIIYSAGEGIVVTDSSGQIVLVNPAAERLLGKEVAQIVAGGFEGLIDDPETIRRLLGREAGRESVLVELNGRILNVFASTISAGDGHAIGSAALLRDVTEEKRLEEELRRLSQTDALTGLYNRRFLDQSLKTEFHRARRTGTELSVIMFDVDHFKRFNDTHGHDQGDRVLRSVAEALRAALRKYDLPCRYGGEEFLAILPNTGGPGAFAVAERLRKDIVELSVDGLKVTISLGVATFPDLAVTGPEELVERADQALYQSKEQGRNRSTIAMPPAAML
jgi:diguanylate cyclase (GGDEF)-like protein/PAS domain S-box-containing protein